MTSALQEAQGTIVKLTEVLSRIAAATPISTNSRTADDMAFWTYAVAKTGLDLVKNRNTPTASVAKPEISAETLTTLQAIQNGFSNGEVRLDLIDDGSVAKAVDELLAIHHHDIGVPA